MNSNVVNDLDLKKIELETEKLELEIKKLELEIMQLEFGNLEKKKILLDNKIDTE